MYIFKSVVLTSAMYCNHKLPLLFLTLLALFITSRCDSLGLQHRTAYPNLVNYGKFFSEQSDPELGQNTRHPQQRADSTYQHARQRLSALSQHGGHGVSQMTTTADGHQHRRTRHRQLSGSTPQVVPSVPNGQFNGYQQTHGKGGARNRGETTPAPDVRNGDDDSKLTKLDALLTQLESTNEQLMQELRQEKRSLLQHSHRNRSRLAQVNHVKQVLHFTGLGGHRYIVSNRCFILQVSAGTGK